MPKTALVTGANRGIGLELCRLLVERGDKVVAACRSVSNALRALDVDIQEGVDVTLESSVGHLVRRLDGMPIDLLINNAGVLSREHLDKLDFEAVKWQFEVNAMGPLRVTHALLSQLPAGAKVGIITSRMGSIADNSSGSRYGYRMSKAAVNIAGVSLAHDLRHRGVAVALLHPGFVKTDMTGGRGTVEPEVAAAGLLARLEALNMENSGSFWHANGEVLPW
jgi:NAD(P)-dependent dehydrogenase (short-subunit alcohol dehydrogenase family)